mmetsp:Transcript_21683/g.72939  ORF Transcript_21683/g.72939 Transcript_21683/m.72939 type:complete len:113 (-) Transcript_21683:616-954(-)
MNSRGDWAPEEHPRKGSPPQSTMGVVKRVLCLALVAACLLAAPQLAVAMDAEDYAAWARESAEPEAQAATPQPYAAARAQPEVPQRSADPTAFSAEAHGQADDAGLFDMSMP